MSDACYNCRFAVGARDTASPVMLVCHRFPPAAPHGFPLVNERDWCGEFEAADEAAKPEKKKR